MNKGNHKDSQEKELGFGSSSSANNARFINTDGSINVERKGLPKFRPYELYHSLITISWGKFLGWVSTSFFLVNLLFAAAYSLLERPALSALSKADGIQKFWDAFFFSVQTITTVGYGAISPVSNPAKIVSSIESFIGLMGIALMTGVLYGRFSRPQTKIRYSKNALIAPYKNGKALMFKMANQRSSTLIEAEVTVVISYQKEGKRVFQKLPLELEKINFFALSWTIVHPIDEDSPMAALQAGDKAELVILLKAFDDTFSQMVYSRMSYLSDDFVWDAKFDSSITQSDGKMAINLQELDNYTLVNEFEMNR